MGQQVLAVAGQVAGAYIGGLVGAPMIGAAIGGAIGGYVGGILFNEDQVFEGPRLSDLKIQTSNWGNAIPIVYGKYRLAGNVIWSTDIREERIETEQGKGGPTATQVDYNYDLDCAIAIGEGEIDYIERIYANGVLIFDARPGASAQNVFAQGLWARGVAFYTGSETQLPDPTMEAALGVGNVPGYRGTCYIVFIGLQLNVLKTATIPNFEFVAVSEATVQEGQQLVQVDTLQPQYNIEILAGIHPTPIISALGETVRVLNSDDKVVRIYDLEGTQIGTEQRTEEEEFFMPNYGLGSPFFVWWSFDGSEVLAAPNLAIGGGAMFTVAGFDMLAVVPTTDFVRGIVACADRENYLVITGPSGSNNVNAWYRVRWDGEDPRLEDQGTIDTTGLTIAEANSWNISPVHQRSSEHWGSMMESDLTHIWHRYLANVYVWEIDAGTKVMSRIMAFDSGILPRRNLTAAGSLLITAIYADKGIAGIVTGGPNGSPSSSWFFLYSRGPQAEGDAIPLVDILTDLSERADLDSSELSFVNITDDVDGFAVGQTMTARAAMEVLRSAYYFDAVDSDTFKFVKRGGASVVEFDYVDLGANSESPSVEAVGAQRAQETELPARINVRYLSMDADYQVAAQSARRETTGSREIAEVNLPIVFEDDNEAAGIADILLRERWAGAWTRSFATTLEYAKYEPTDVIRLDDGFAIRTVRISRKVDKSNFIEWEAIDEDVEAYDSNAAAAVVSVPAQTVAIQGPTAFEVLDIPPLSTLADGNESAAYVAAKGYFAPWSGASIDVSRNDGNTYQAGTSVTQASVIGATTTLLPNFLGGNVFDEASTVRVEVGAGTLSSATHDEVLDGANPCVIGNEVLQFRTASLVGAGVYDLSGFLRGRKGTEQYIGTHEIGDRFVLLTTYLRNLPLQLSDRALDALYVRGTTGGAFVSTGLVKSFAPEVARLMPYSPVHLSAVRNADGSWYLSWVRRDRYNNDWNSGVDIPMSEAVELYDVEIYNAAGELVETYTDVNDTFLNLDDDVLGGSPTPASITYSVWQKSALVGRGFEAQATINQAL